MIPTPSGFDIAAANQHAIAQAVLSILAPLVAGVALLWWKLHRIGMSWKQFQQETIGDIDPKPTPGPSVYVPAPIRLEFVQVAPPVEPDQYRDDTGTQAARS